MWSWHRVAISMREISYYKDDYSQERLGYQCSFYPRVAHVYQHQKNINVLVFGAILQLAYFCSFKKYNPYHYQLKPRQSLF